jgi:putative transposase
VDTQGNLLRIVVHQANIQDRDGALLVGAQLGRSFQGLKVIWFDSGYLAQSVRVWFADELAVTALFVKPSLTREGQRLLPKRWVVERTFAWINRSRRLSKDYESLPQVSETWIYMAMARRSAHYLATHP